MIAYFYPPLAGMGMLRTLKFAKYLPKFGWQSVILTPRNGRSYAYCEESEGDLPRAEIIRTNFADIDLGIYKFFGCTTPSTQRNDNHPTQPLKVRPEAVRRLSGYIWEWINFPDGAIGWYPFAVQAGKDYISRKGVDLIYSTSSPETSHLIACYLKKKTGLPWVADFRDLWTANPYYDRSSFRKRIEKVVESHILKHADAAITVSKVLAHKMHSYLPFLNGKIYVVPNGYDEDDFQAIQYTPPSKFIIIYTGRLYRFKRDPEILFKVLSHLIEKGKMDPDRVEAHFYVGDIYGFRELVRKHNLHKVVKFHSFVPYKESLKRQMEASILLLLQWEPRHDSGVYTGKIFEYLRAHRPILAIPSSSEVVEELLNKTNAGIVVSNEDELENVLIEWYQEYIKTGMVSYKGVESEINKYTREKCTKKLASILDDVISIGSKK